MWWVVNCKYFKTHFEIRSPFLLGNTYMRSTYSKLCIFVCILIGHEIIWNWLEHHFKYMFVNNMKSYEFALKISFACAPVLVKIAGMCYKFHANCCLKIIFIVMLWWQAELVWNVSPNKINILTSKPLNPWQETIILPRWPVITLVPESACSCASSSHQTACMSIE